MSFEAGVLFVLAAYLIGSIPTGYILTRYSTGKNILEEGSGNAGSTNVKRVAGRKIAVITQLSDMMKGLLPVGLYIVMSYDTNLDYNQNIISNPWVYCVALASILGHDFSVFLRFKGGKGVNTTLGASVLLAPLPVFISVAVYFIIKRGFRYVSLGSIALGITLPVSGLLIYGTVPTFYYLIICMLLIIVLHRKNIDRLLHSRELTP